MNWLDTQYRKRIKFKLCMEEQKCYVFKVNKFKYLGYNDEKTRKKPKFN